MPGISGVPFTKGPTHVGAFASSGGLPILLAAPTVAPSLRALGTPVSTSTLTPSFPAPAGAQPTDVVLALFFADDGHTIVTGVPVGFTQIADLPQSNDVTTGSPSHCLIGYWGRFADVGAGPYAFTLSAPGTPFVEGRTAAIQDCITTGNPFEASDGSTSGTTAVTTAPLVTGTSLGPNRYAFYAATNWTGGAWTPAAGMTEQWDANNRIITYDDQQLPAATTITPQAVNVSSNRSNAWVGIFLPTSATVNMGVPPISPLVISQPLPAPRVAPTVLLAAPPPSVVVAVATGSPLVVSVPSVQTSGVVLTLRNPQAPAVVTSGPITQPIVATAPPSIATSLPIVVRSTLADPPVLTAASPLVAAPPPPTVVPSRPILLASPAAPAVVVSTVTALPLVVTSPASVPPSAPVLIRSTLADPPVLATASPSVNSTPPGSAPVAAPVLLRAPAPPVVAPSSTTPSPLVVTAASSQTTAQPLIVRSTLTDPPVLTTPGPMVVSATPLPPNPASAVTPLRPQTAPAVVSAPGIQPLVVSAAPAPAAQSAPIVSRGSLADLLVATKPLVVSAPPPIVQGAVVQSRPFVIPPPTGPFGSTTEPLVITAPIPPLRGVAILTRERTALLPSPMRPFFVLEGVTTASADREDGGSYGTIDQGVSTYASDRE